MDKMELLETMERARMFQAERGHADELIYESGEVCMQGATFMALGWGANGSNDHGYLGIPYVDVQEAVAEQLRFDDGGFSRTGSMCDWNNAPERTLEEVLARFDEGIERLRIELGLPGKGKRVRVTRETPSTPEPIQIPTPVEAPEPEPVKVGA